MINWQMVCLRLRSSKQSMTAIAKQCGTDWQHLNRLARGEVKQPKFDVGIRLLDLHYEYCNEAHIKMVWDDKN